MGIGRKRPGRQTGAGGGGGERGRPGGGNSQAIVVLVHAFELRVARYELRVFE